MCTYLFAWNPKRWTWTDLDAQIEQVGLSGHTDDRWSSGNTKQIPSGSRFFLIRLGLELKRIIGSGVTLSAPDYGPHWDEDKAASGSETLYCNIRFDYLTDDVLVTWEDFQKPPFSPFRWACKPPALASPRLLRRPSKCYGSPEPQALQVPHLLQSLPPFPKVPNGKSL